MIERTLFREEHRIFREPVRRFVEREIVPFHAQDTSELFFDGVRVPAANMLGGEGQGFAHMMTKLAQERLAQAIRSALVTETIIAWTVEYTSQRRAFGKTIADSRSPAARSRS